MFDAGPDAMFPSRAGRRKRRFASRDSSMAAGLR
jgi:hypothetical protein